MKTLMSYVISALLCSIVSADDFKTVDGKEYKNVTLSRVEPDGLVVFASYGIIKIPFTDLSPEIQKKYGYDAKAATDFQQRQYEADVARAREISEAKQKRQHELEEWSKSRQSHQEMPAAHERSAASSLHGTMLDERPAGPSVFLYAEVMQVVDEGLLVSVRETNTFGTEPIPGGATVLLLGQFSGYFDDDKIQVSGQLIGAHQYTTVLGSKRTARAVVVSQITKIVQFPSFVR